MILKFWIIFFFHFRRQIMIWNQGNLPPGWRSGQLWQVNPTSRHQMKWQVHAQIQVRPIRYMTVMYCFTVVVTESSKCIVKGKITFKTFRLKHNINLTAELIYWFYYSSWGTNKSTHKCTIFSLTFLILPLPQVKPWFTASGEWPLTKILSTNVKQ